MNEENHYNQDPRLWEKHAFLLGKLIGDLSAIESLARLFLELQEVGGNLGATRPNLVKAREGDWVEITALSNRHSLEWALNTYNSRIKALAPELRIDAKNIIRLRNALAHCRQFGIGNSPYLTLVKFSKRHKDNKVQVELRVDMTKEWFDQQTSMLYESLSRLTKSVGWIDEQLEQPPDAQPAAG